MSELWRVQSSGGEWLMRLEILGESWGPSSVRAYWTNDETKAWSGPKQIADAITMMSEGTVAVQ